MVENINKFHIKIGRLCKEKDWINVANEFLNFSAAGLKQDQDRRRKRASDLLQTIDDKGYYSHERLSKVLSLIYRSLEILLESNIKLRDRKHDRAGVEISCGLDLSSEMIQFINLFASEEILERKINATVADQIVDAMKSGKTSLDHTELEIPPILRSLWNIVLQTRIERSIPLTMGNHYERHTEERRKDSSNAEVGSTISTVTSTSGFVSEQIFKGAILAQRGVKNFIVPNVNKHIEAVGDFVKKNTDPVQEGIHRDDGSSIEKLSGNCVQKNPIHDDKLNKAVSLSSTSVEVTDILRRGVRTAAFNIRDFGTRKVNDMSSQWKENELGKQIVPDEEVRLIAAAAGKVGISTLGAAAILVETLFDASSSIAKTSVRVASDVTTHAHGEEAGKVVENAGIVAGNIIRVATHVAALEPIAMSKWVARNTGKVSMEDQR